jgi:hypothetical protein
MVKRALAIVGLLFFSCLAVAEEQESEIWQNIKSPITTPARYALYAGGALTLTLLILEDQVIDPAQEETIENTPLGHSSKWGDQLGQIYPNAAYVVGMLGYGAIASDKQALKDASLMFQATLYSGIAATALKYTVREPRPNNSERRNSFPSGHATTIFAFASYIGCIHSLPWGIAAYSAAGFVAFSRMNDNAHWVHDVTGGATIGTAYGLGVCMAENGRKGKGIPIKTIGYLVPLDGGLAAGLSHSF